MAIPIGMWETIIFLALLGTAASWFTKDYNNYTNAISGIVATILWFVSGISCLIGIQAENMTFTAGYLMWIFVAFGVIEAILTIVKILDIVTARKEQRYTSLDTIHL
jgi:hypothetical protein